MNVILSGGGTGGHVNPAIAIADTICAAEPDSKITFVGTPRGIENKLVPAAGYELRHVDISGLKRSLSLSNLRTAWLVLTSPAAARKILREIKPDIVIGTGGYVCWPIVRSAAMAGIPTALHESNAIPGVAVKMLQGCVDKIFINFEDTALHLRFPEKAVRVGNPLRGAFGQETKEQARAALGYEGKYRYLLLSCGGSMGAERINHEVFALMRDFTSKHPEIKHIHATGAIEYNDAIAEFRGMGLDKSGNLECVEYIYDMPRKMTAADLVINRSGAITLSELATLSKPCILIPSPNVTDDHQYKNAAALAAKGAAVVLRESELGEGVLLRAVSELFSDRARLRSMGENISGFAVNNCNNLIYSQIKTLVK